MNNTKPLLVFVITSTLTDVLVTGLELFYQQHGRIFNARIFSTHDIDEETVSVDSLAQSLESADMVFLDIRAETKPVGSAPGSCPEHGSQWHCCWGNPGNHVPAPAGVFFHENHTGKTAKKTTTAARPGGLT